MISELARAISAAPAAAGAGPVEVTGARGGYAGLVLAALRREVGRPLVVVAADEERARDLRLALAFFEDTSGVLDPVPAFPALDHAAFSGMSPSRVLVMERVATLFRMVHGLETKAVVVSAAALLDRVMPKEALERHAWPLAPGDRVDREELMGFLSAGGYHPVATCEDPGTFAVRGGLVDVFAPAYDEPLRIELWGDEVDTIRFFDPTTQATDERLDAVWLGPARNVLFDDSGTRRAKAALLALADELEVPTSRARAMVDDVAAGILGVGMEDLLPAFHDRLDSFFDLAPRDALWVVDEPERVEAALEARWQEVRDRAEKARAGAGTMAYSAERLFLPAAEAGRRLRDRTDLVLADFSLEDRPARRRLRYDATDNKDVRQEIEKASQGGEEHVLAGLTKRVRAWRAEGLAVVACAHAEGAAARLAGLLGHYGLSVDRRDGAFHLDLVPSLRASDRDVALFTGDPGVGFRARDVGLVLLDESEVLGRRPHRRRRHAQVAPEAALASWRDLQEGDFVVHLLHGIGRYLGLEKSVVSGLEVDFLVLEYAEGNRLFVPVDKLHLVSKHTPGDHAAPGLDKLGGTGWQRRKSKVRKAVRDIAEKLLRIYAERELREGHAYARPGEYFARFEAAFPWEETPDQLAAIDDVLADMQRPRPMDRLVCGDVGFGKTEVALRAAMLAVLDGKQVAVLVPTVVLAEQHRMTFERRMEGFPVVVESLARTHTPADLRRVVERVSRGEVDVVIGTHRLLSKDVAFKDLGLVIVDEEHRFGVDQKERLKGLSPEVDVLTLTATPIPRTLNLAMSGLRDISLIQTPPIDRLSIRTLVAQPTESVIQEAIRAELARGGQVFFVHNRVEDIEDRAEVVRRLVPEARVAVGHGQMDKARLEEIVLTFVRGESNVLVCTTIIESGLDIPNANTILIHRADRLGLAQLYQLRGRVGRSSVRAVCYLLVPSPGGLTGEAAQRIATIQRFTELGSGFSIASHDLDIRGAGDLLGADQAGNIESVGYDAYLEMLREAVETLRAEKEGRSLEERVDPELKVALEARIPETWLPETTLRLRLYKDLAGAETVDEVFLSLTRAVDRYGRAPDAVRNLAELMAVKIEARALGLSSAGYNRHRISLGLTKGFPLSGPPLSEFLHRGGGAWSLTPDLQLVRRVTETEWSRGMETLRSALREVAEAARAHRRPDRFEPRAPR